MRRFIFRAWLKDEKRMLHHNDISLTAGKVFERVYSPATGYMNSFKRDDAVLMQYTGLKDKNGVGIYEGDILLDHWGEMVLVKFGNHLTSTDYYASEAYGWFGEQISNTENTFSLDNGGEIIGNIYENPELLEGDAE